MNNKKGFTLIELMIVVAIIAILAMIAVPMYQRYIERSRNSASQNLLHQITTAMTAYNVDASEYLPTATATKADIELLLPYGFRPDPNVGFEILHPTSAVPGFIAYAAHKAQGSRLYVYDNIAASGVRPMASLTQTMKADGTPDVTTDTACTAALNVYSMDPGDPTLMVLDDTITITAAGITQ